MHPNKNDFLQAMKVVNTVKLKEEFDYESLCRTLENQVDHLNAEIDRQQKLREKDNNEIEKKLKEFQKSSAEAEKSLVVRTEVIFFFLVFYMLYNIA